MDFLRCAVSFILLVFGGKCILDGQFDASLLPFLIAVIVLPYDEVPKFFGPLSFILVIFGFSALSSGDYYRGVLCIAITLITAAKLNTKENKSVGSYIGGYSSSSADDYEQQIEEMERERKEREEEEWQRRMDDEWFYEQQRQKEKLYEEWRR